jgi:hypothetical protein
MIKRITTKASILAILISLSIASMSWGLTTQQIAKDAFPSVVLLVMEDANGVAISVGSGFFVRSNIIATNLHVIKGAKGGYAKLFKQKKKNEIAGTVGIDEEADLVLLFINGVKGKPLSIGESIKVQVGDEIYAVGNPLGFEGTFSKGIISGVRSTETGVLFQITAPISPGSSGGPILNVQGKVVGISVATIKGGQNLNFAIPVNFLSSLLSKTIPVDSEYFELEVTPLSVSKKNEKTKLQSKPKYLSPPYKKKKFSRVDRFKYDNGTLIDTKTGLMWSANDNGSDINWYNAKKYCENYRAGGYIDWRMPNQAELETIYDPDNCKRIGYGSCNFVIEFIGITAHWVWGSEISGSKATAFDFSVGRRIQVPCSYGYNRRVLPVRGGK